MKKAAGNWGDLFFLCGGYYVFYVVFGLYLKWLLDTREGFPGMSGMEALWHTTVGGTAVCLLVVILFRWPARLQSTQPRILGGLLPGEYAWLIPSGIFTGFVIPTTTLMYTFGYSVMVAMVLMRSSLIIAGRIVDAILIRQGHLDKQVSWQENAAVGAAMVAMSLVLFGAKAGDFQFFQSTPAMITMTLYIVPYSVRVYILSRFKTKADHKAIFGIEQIFASSTIFLLSLIGYLLYRSGWQTPQLIPYAQGMEHPNGLAVLIGVPFGIAAFFSVFLFLFKTGTATFNTTVNRLTSLVAGTTATLLYHYAYGGKAVHGNEWLALAFILLSIGFLGWSGIAATRRKAAA